MNSSFIFRPMAQREAETIANDWKYDGIYSFYDISADHDDYLEFIDPDKRGSNYFSCYLNDELSAYYCVEVTDGGVAELGLGMNPKLTGKGMGLGFVNALIIHASAVFGVNEFTLSVATFNRRAISVYRRAGFVDYEVFMQHTNGGEYEFLRMKLNREEDF